MENEGGTTSRLFPLLSFAALTELTLAILGRSPQHFPMSRFPRSLSAAFLCFPAFSLLAQTPAVTKPPALGDPQLKLEVFAQYPDVETPTTVVGAPDGSVFVGNDPRDSRLSTSSPVCTVVRYSSLGPDRKKTIFAEKLYSPAGMAWHDGWLYILHDPLLTRLKDTKGTGVADVREDLVTDLGQPPHDGLNDHVVSGFTMGMDGYFYISIGDKGVYHARGKDGSEVTLWGGGVVRVRPDGTHLEVYSGGTRNHLEVDLDAMDHAFTLDNTDDGKRVVDAGDESRRERLLRVSFLFQKRPDERSEDGRSAQAAVLAGCAGGE